MYQDLPERFVNEVLSYVGVGEDDECWEWTRNGKPFIQKEEKINGQRVIYSIYVQKMILERKLGRESTSRTVNLSCGNYKCCNPNHIFENDMVSRFMRFVDKDGTSGCWIWTGAIFQRNGYGCFTINSQPLGAHRVSYDLFSGGVPEGLMVLHKCNNKRCVNPEHLYAGTHEDNMNDLRNANIAKGEKNANSILKEEQVLEIRKLAKSRLVTYQKIAEMFGVKRQTVKDIALGRTWAWLE